jgi:GT2 family glycosyltransferase
MVIMTTATVVITSYNQGPMIREAFESVLAQTVRPERIIIVDDGSTDPVSLDVLQQLEAKAGAVAEAGSQAIGAGGHGAGECGERSGEPDGESDGNWSGKLDELDGGFDGNQGGELCGELDDEPEIELIRQANAGPSAARNRGIAAATTPFVVVLDGDDRLLPTFIERTAALMEADDDYVAASGWLKTFGVLDSVIRPTGGDAAAFVSHNCCPATCMIRASAWKRCGGYDETMRSGFEDWDFFLSMLGCGDADDACNAKIGIVPEPLIEYRTAPASSNVVSMTKRLDLMRFLMNKHQGLYAEHYADAVIGVEAISMARLTMWETLMRGDAASSQDFMAHPTYGDGGMAAAVRLRS